MRNDIKIRESDYLETTEDNYINKLKIDYHRTSFSTYDSYKPYLHIQVGEYDDFNLYVEVDEYQMEKIIKQLQEQLNKVKYGF
jgi:hypothetical protein